MKTFGLDNQNCSMTDLDFLLLIAGKPLVKLHSLWVNSCPMSPHSTSSSPAMLHVGWGGGVCAEGHYIHGNKYVIFLKSYKPPMPLRYL